MNTRLTPAQLREARGWIADCEWDEDIDVYALSDTDVERGIARHYSGGIAEFIRDSGV